MQFLVVFFITILAKDISAQAINSTQPANEAAQNAFQQALQNGVDLPTNLQNSLQTIINNTRNLNGTDVPNLSNIPEKATPSPIAQNPFGAAPSQNIPTAIQNLPSSLSQAGQNLPTNSPSNLNGAAQNLPSSLNQAAQSLPSSLNQAAQRIPTNLPSSLDQAAQNIPASFAQNTPPSIIQPAQNLPSNLAGVAPNAPFQRGQNFPQNTVPNLAQNVPQSVNQPGQNLPNLIQNFPNFQSNFVQARERLAQLQNSRNPLLNSQNLTSLLPTLQNSLGQFPNLNQLPLLQNFSQNGFQLPLFPQGGSFLQNLSQLPSTFGQGFPSLSSNGLLQNSPQGSQGLAQNVPASSQNTPNLASAFGSNAPPNSPTSSLPTNSSSLTNFDLKEENGSEISKQRRGQISNSGSTIFKTKPLTRQNTQPGGLLNNLQQFTGNQLDTTKKVLRDSAHNLLELHKMRRLQKRLLGDQQRSGGLLGGSGGLAGGLTSPLGILSGNPLDTSGSTQASNNAANPTTQGQNTQSGSSPLGLRGLLGIGKK